MFQGMVRPLRIELAAGLYHVTSRGDRREGIFRDDQDLEEWLTVLGEVCSRYNWRCHAYCEMTNHYPVVVETPEANLSQGMRQLNGVYTQKLHAGNRRPLRRALLHREPSRALAQDARTTSDVIARSDPGAPLAFLRGTLPPSRTEEIHKQLLAKGIPA